jgi:hypothetical protein
MRRSGDRSRAWAPGSTPDLTLPRKNSRSIDVDALRFRYVISWAGAGDVGQFSLKVTVQIESGRGCIMKADGLLARDRWLDFPEIASPENYPTIKPGHIAALIRRARTNGWEPESLGAPFLVTITPAEFQI